MYVLKGFEDKKVVIMKTDGFSLEESEELVPKEGYMWGMLCGGANIEVCVPENFTELECRLLISFVVNRVEKGIFKPVSSIAVEDGKKIDLWYYNDDVVMVGLSK